MIKCVKFFIVIGCILIVGVIAFQLLSPEYSVEVTIDEIVWDQGEDHYTCSDEEGHLYSLREGIVAEYFDPEKIHVGTRLKVWYDGGLTEMSILGFRKIRYIKMFS